MMVHLAPERSPRPFLRPPPPGQRQRAKRGCLIGKGCRLGGFVLLFWGAWGAEMARIALMLFFALTSLKGIAGDGIFDLELIVIDPGHGGRDPGCVNRWGGVEKEINLAVALYLKGAIEREGIYRAVMTRQGDQTLSLEERARIANRYPPDKTLFISLHCNSSPNGEGRGIETYVFDLEATDRLAQQVAERENALEVIDPLRFILNDLRHRSAALYSEMAARLIQRALVSRLKAGDRRIRRAPFKILADVKMPAVLVEMGFLSDKVEQRKLRSKRYQRAIAEAIYEGIKRFDRELSAAHKGVARSSR